MDVMEAVRTRASIRMFKADPIDDSALDTIMEAVHLCQSWANTQCWEVVLVKDPSIKEQLREAAGKGNPSYKGWMNAPIIAVFCAKKNSSGYYGGKECTVTGKGDWFMFDMGMAVENFCLAAHELGLGTVTVGLFDAAAVEKILGMPEEYTVVTMNPLGYPDQPFRSPKRKESASFIHTDRF